MWVVIDAVFKRESTVPTAYPDSPAADLITYWSSDWTQARAVCSPSEQKHGAHLSW